MTYEDDMSLRSESEQMFRDSVRKKIIIGVILFIALPLIPIYIFLGQNILSFELILPTSIMLLFIGLFGIIVLAYYWQGSSLLYRSAKIMQKLAPPNVIFEGKCAVMNKDPVYLLAQWGVNAVRFIGFHHAETSFEHKTKIPGLIWRWEYNQKIGAIDFARKEGEFTIPVDESSYITGEGIMYSVLLYRQSVVNYPRDLSKEQLEKIIEQLIEDLGKNDSELSDFADYEEGY